MHSQRPFSHLSCHVADDVFPLRRLPTTGAMALQRLWRFEPWADGDGTCRWCLEQGPVRMLSVLRNSLQSDLTIGDTTEMRMQSPTLVVAGSQCQAWNLNTLRKCSLEPLVKHHPERDNVFRLIVLRMLIMSNNIWTPAWCFEVLTATIAGSSVHGKRAVSSCWILFIAPAQQRYCTFCSRSITKVPFTSLYSFRSRIFSIKIIPYFHLQNIVFNDPRKSCAESLRHLATNLLWTLSLLRIQGQWLENYCDCYIMRFYMPICFYHLLSWMVSLGS